MIYELQYYACILYTSISACVPIMRAAYPHFTSAIGRIRRALGTHLSFQYSGKCAPNARTIDAYTKHHARTILGMCAQHYACAVLYLLSRIVLCPNTT